MERSMRMEKSMQALRAYNSHAAACFHCTRRDTQQTGTRCKPGQQLHKAFLLLSKER